MAQKRNNVNRGVSPNPKTATTTSSSTTTAPLPPTPNPAAPIPGSSRPTSSHSATTTSAKTSASAPVAQTWDKVVSNLTTHYQKSTPQRTKLLDAFMAFLVVVGVLQFVYCVLAGNYPFNAFLSGFSATVGQFVLTASLRIQTTEANKKDFPAVSPERAFADYVVCSLILHFFCVNFIN
ncbi:Putative Dolichyl-diphosphooligosaccharide--protein glycosyltransferase subunit [Podospora comata]|uniref:Dolichyl-diphosphooligosaccharide--protein glycosyltransferase subunit OST2 n=1 Tax=Podospora comata TaxID=48703 RepID=A0ABY6RW49_PODCO|nr:Putative Dolichyl-diphosphooligosaccharide--protein glycosyltransferase subunit [Podospora comata]